MAALPAIRELVERFEAHRESYRSGQYNEAQVREEFVNPFPGPARQQVVGPWVFVIPLRPAPASPQPSDPSAPA